MLTTMTMSINKNINDQHTTGSYYNTMVECIEVEIILCSVYIILYLYCSSSKMFY